MTSDRRSFNADHELLFDAVMALATSLGAFANKPVNGNSKQMQEAAKVCRKSHITFPVGDGIFRRHRWRHAPNRCQSDEATGGIDDEYIQDHSIHRRGGSAD